MSHQSDLIADDIHAYLKQHEEKDLLRFITCGSVDDGKSTLIGRLLHDTKMIYEDQLAAISKDSKAHGTTGEKIDLALLVDGLQSEREQGITIDVAYRYFSTDKRKFIIADTPGHEQYTRNMATGASTASLAILLIDARYGVQTQTRRHSFICSLLGIKHFVIAINKMDLMDFSEARFNEIKAEYDVFAKNLNVPDIQFIPISALDGDNVADRSARSPWYTGSVLLDMLENVSVADDANIETARFPVQYVNRPHLDFRGFCGTVAAGIFTPGQAVKALPSNKISTIKDIVVYEGDIGAAYPGDAVTLTLNDEIDISRGDMIVAANDNVKPVNVMTVDIVWMHETALELNHNYYVKVGTAEVSGAVTTIDYQVDVNTLEKQNVDQLPLNGIARCKLELTQEVLIDPYLESRFTGNLILIDRLTNVTVGAGMVVKAHSDAHLAWHDLEVNKQSRAEKLGQKPLVCWFTSKSAETLASPVALLEKALFSMGFSTYLLQRSNSESHAQASQLLLDAGQLVLVDGGVHDAAELNTVKNMFDEGDFFSIQFGSDADTSQADMALDPEGLDDDQIVSHLLKKLHESDCI